MRKQAKFMEDVDVQRLIQQMNQAMLNRQESEAQRMAQEIIAINSKIIYPYEILAEIYDREGEILKLYEVKKVVAQQYRLDTKSWLDCARLARHPLINELKKSVKYYYRVTKQLKGPKQSVPNINSYKEILFIKLEKFQVYKMRKDFSMILKSIAILLEELGQYEENDHNQDKNESSSNLSDDTSSLATDNEGQ